MALMELRNVCTYYGNIQALRNISLSIEEGEIVTLIGANGAGKTTTLMSICGITSIRSGEILLDGVDISRQSPHKIVAMGLSQVPEGRRIFPQLTVAENLDMGAFLRDNKVLVKADLEEVFELFPRLAERRNQQGGTLSGGEQQMLALRSAGLRPDQLWPAALLHCVGWRGAAHRPQHIRDHQAHQRGAADDHLPRRTECQHGPEDRKQGLCAPERQHQDGGLGREPARERRSPQGVPGSVDTKEG